MSDQKYYYVQKAADLTPMTLNIPKLPDRPDWAGALFSSRAKAEGFIEADARDLNMDAKDLGRVVSLTDGAAQILLACWRTQGGQYRFDPPPGEDVDVNDLQSGWPPRETPSAD